MQWVDGSKPGDSGGQAPGRVKQFRFPVQPRLTDANLAPPDRPPPQASAVRLRRLFSAGHKRLTIKPYDATPTTPPTTFTTKIGHRAGPEHARARMSNGASGQRQWGRSDSSGGQALDAQSDPADCQGLHGRSLTRLQMAPTFESYFATAHLRRSRDYSVPARWWVIGRSPAWGGWRDSPAVRSVGPANPSTGGFKRSPSRLSLAGRARGQPEAVTAARLSARVLLLARRAWQLAWVTGQSPVMAVIWRAKRRPVTPPVGDDWRCCRRWSGRSAVGAGL